MENSSAIKGADYAREMVAGLERDTKQLAARKAMARLAIKHGNYDEAAKDVWRAYLETL